MTGFARAGGETAGMGWVLELKSVNGRGLDVRFRLPPPFDALEAELRQRVQKVLARGNLQIGLTVRRKSAAGSGRFNEELFLKYADIAEKMAWAAKLAAPTTGDILRLPGVIEAGDSDDEALADPARNEFLAAFDAALADLLAARRSEGRALRTIVAGLLDTMADRVAALEAADGERRAAIPERLRAQVAAILQAGLGFDEQRLHQEAVLVATRIDIREEVDRLKAHIGQGRALLDSGEAVGRKLDFLSQEFVRETNTICSKANDLALTRIGLDLKTIVEQFREQVQNIE
jgi:uncharacterized protein (TIGR00255 family)